MSSSSSEFYSFFSTSGSSDQGQQSSMPGQSTLGGAFLPAGAVVSVPLLATTRQLILHEMFLTAVMNNQVEKARLYLRQGADINYSHPYTGDTALMIAAFKNNLPMAKLLLTAYERVDIIKRNCSRMCAQDLAITAEMKKLIAEARCRQILKEIQTLVNPYIFELDQLHEILQWESPRVTLMLGTGSKNITPPPSSLVSQANVTPPPSSLVSQANITPPLSPVVSQADMTPPLTPVMSQASFSPPPSPVRSPVSFAPLSSPFSRLIGAVETSLPVPLAASSALPTMPVSGPKKKRPTRSRTTSHVIASAESDTDIEAPSQEDATLTNKPPKRLRR